MNYEDNVGTDWSDIDLDNALVRAFALGMAAATHAPDGELDRLRSVATSRYERELIETAYREGHGFERRAGNLDDGTSTLPPYVAEHELDITTKRGRQRRRSTTDAAPPVLRLTPVHRRSLPPAMKQGPPSLLYRSGD